MKRIQHLKSPVPLNMAETFRLIFKILIICGLCMELAFASSDHQKIVESPENFRDISLHTWQGLARLGIPDSKGLPILQTQNYNLSQDLKNKPELAKQLGDSLELHNYSLGLLAILDYMRANQDCFTALDSYEARKEQCSGVLIQHNSQLAPWKANIRHLALALKPNVHSKLFCQSNDENNACGATNLEQITLKEPNGRVKRLDEFQRRDFFAQLMKNYRGDFERFWQKAVFPKEAWLVQTIRLSEYDFNKQQYLFDLSPTVGFTNRQFPVLQQPGKKHVKNAIQSRVFSISPSYQAKLDFEQGRAFANANSIKVALPVEPSKAREIGQLNKQRIFFAVTKIRFLPRTLQDAWKPVSSASKVSYHFAENKVSLYQDSGLENKVVEIPINDAVIESPVKAEEDKELPWSQEARVFDARAYALLRLQHGPINEDSSQTIANSVAQNERRLWAKHQSALAQLKKPLHEGKTQAQQQQIENTRRALQDRAKLAHVNWQQIDADKKQTLFDFMMGESDPNKSWPDSFDAVNWGLNIATIFPKGHFSSDPNLAHLPANEQDKTILKKFLNEFANRYQTKNMTLVYGLSDISYDPQTKQLDFSRRWPFRLRPNIMFDDDESHKISSQLAPLVSAKAKSKAIYPFTTSTAQLGSLIPDPKLPQCKRNNKTQSEDCVIRYQTFLQAQWPSASFALDRELAIPKVQMDAQQSAKLLNSRSREHSGWRLVVELQNIDMEVSKFEYKSRNKAQPIKAEAQTIFASVKNAFIVAPNGEVIWRASAEDLNEPVDGSKLLTDKEPDFSWQSPVTLFSDGQANKALYDFMFAKYYPNSLDKRFLEAMFSSRWIYENSTDEPVGGRFFNQQARTPTWQDLQRALPDFKTWLTVRATSLPNNIKILMPMRYANNTVTTTQCAKLRMTPKSPLRNSGSAQIIADSKVRQCETAERQALSQFNRCEQLRANLASAEVRLSDAEKEGCKQANEATNTQNTNSDSESINENSSCNFNNLELTQLQQAAMSCIAERCGATPKTMAEMTSYQQCAQSVTTEVQTQLQAALSGGQVNLNKSKTKNNSLDNCKPHRNDIRNTKSSMKSYRCDNHVAAPEPMNCKVLGEIEIASHMHVERLDLPEKCGGQSAFMRKSNSSASLLPSAKAYSDTNLHLEMAFDKIEIPYDPPYSSSQKNSNAILELEMEIKTAEASNRKNQMKFLTNIKSMQVKEAK